MPIKRKRGPRVVIMPPAGGPPPTDPPPEEPKAPARVPPKVTLAKLPEMRRPSSKGLSKLTEAVVNGYGKAVLTEFFQSLLEGVTAGDVPTMRMAGEAYGILQGKGGFVINNTVQNNNATVNVGSNRKFDNLVRMIEQEEKTGAIDV